MDKVIEEALINIAKMEDKENLNESGIIEQAVMKGLTDKIAAEALTSEKQIVGTPTSVDNLNLVGTDKDIVESLDIPFEMFDNYILVKPLKPQNIKKKIEVLDDKKNKGKQPHQEMATKRVTKSVQTDYREGIVLVVGPNAFFHDHTDTDSKVKIEIGDKVIFHKNLVDRSWFDLFKDSLLLRNYDLVARVI